MRISEWLFPAKREEESLMRPPPGGTLALLKPIVLQEFQLSNSYIRAIQVSLWHNMSGPTRIAVWHGRDSLSEELSDRIGRLTLVGEMAAVEYDPAAQIQAFQTKTKILREHDVIAMAVNFSATKPCRPEGLQISTTKYAFNIVLPYALLRGCTQLHTTLSDRVYHLARIYHSLVSIVGDEGAVEGFHDAVREFMQHSELWFAAVNRVPPPVNIYDTKLAMVDPLSPGRVLPLDSSERDFLCRALTAFFHCHGHAVVCADTPREAAVWVQTLAMFLPIKDRVRITHPNRLQEEWDSKESPLTLPATYVPDLKLQGLPPSESPSYRQLLYNRFPSAVLDVKRQIVSVTPSFIDYGMYRDRFMRDELAQFTHKALEAAHPPNGDHPHRRPAHNSDLGEVHTHKSRAPSVLRLVDFLLKNSVQARQGYIENWLQSMYLKASRLVRHVAEEDSRPQIAPSPAHSLDPDRLAFSPQRAKDWEQPRFWQDMEVDCIDDQLVCLSFAESLRPGTWSIVRGTTKHQLQQFHSSI